MCEKCPKREKCKTLCKKVKAHLRKCGIKSVDWIRPRVSPLKDKKDNLGCWREIPFSALSPNINSDKNPYFDENE